MWEIILRIILRNTINQNQKCHIQIWVNYEFTHSKYLSVDQILSGGGGNPKRLIDDSIVTMRHYRFLLINTAFPTETHKAAHSPVIPTSCSNAQL